MKNKSNVSKHDGPGRPKYTPSFPRSKEWTFTDLMEANGIETNPKSKRCGKGPNCTMLTLRKYMARDMFLGKGRNKRVNPRSNVVMVQGVTSEPSGTSGLGRRAYLYSLRANASVKRAAAAPSTPRKAKTVKAVKVAAIVPGDNISEATKTYEELKSLLAVPSTEPVAPVIPAVTLTVPAVEIAPEVAPAVEVPAVAVEAPVVAAVPEVAPVTA